jgi:hypothetical protein
MYSIFTVFKANRKITTIINDKKKEKKRREKERIRNKCTHQHADVISSTHKRASTLLGKWRKPSLVLIRHS